MDNRRSIFQSIIGALAFLWFALTGRAATAMSIDQIQAPQAGGLIGVGANRRLSQVTLGVGLDLTGGVLSAKAATSPGSTAKLKRDPQGNYPLPIGVRSKTKVYRGGLRMALGADPDGDYTIVADMVIPSLAFPWKVDDFVQADGE